MDEIQKKKLKKLIEELGSIKGRHTELISVYVPQGFNLDKIVDQIRSEQSVTQNVKDKTVRKNVLSALERILQHLKLYKSTPENGLVIFSGNVSEKEGTADIEIFAIEPPEPLKTKLYWCDQKFALDPLKEMIKEKEVYGLIVVDKSDAEIGLLHGKKVQSLKHLGSLVPGKTKKGGWSQARYARVREGLLNDFLKKVGDVASTQFKEYELRGVIIGGPGPIKENFANGDFLSYDVKKKVMGIINTAYTGEYGLKEMVDKSEELMKEASVMKEKRLLEMFFDHFAKDSGLAIYGIKEVVNALKEGNIETLLISEDFDWIKASLECPGCGDKKEEVIMEGHEEVCEKCNVKMDVVSKKDLLDDVIKMAEDIGTKIEMVSTDTEKGVQLKELGGIAGILRFKS